MSSSIYEIFHYTPSIVNQCSSITLNNNTSYLNSSFNSLQQPFIPCQLHNITDNYTNHVQIVDSNYLMRAPTHFDCYILLFFARWCHFSVHFAPYFNALPRSFPGLDFVAYDVSKSLRYMTYFGTNAVPSVFILRKNKLLARLNSTNDIQILISLIESTLHLNQTNNLTIEDEDRIGPVTTIYEPSFDYALLFSWLFVGLFIYYYAEKYNLLTRIRQRFSREN
ncbi:unnamed protein product [Rotaria sp. Silwood1]|nr:unnamed protein product [Rotaria sp. Silwood1]CAF1137890.1 unnamed protein product [Rotaria sp. Silwood1]CAF3465102.1 unnamed protein product [Rotaria sp. Silwood1]CAF3474206.1 unnamed protein product [Rotaria sp. Silwood1]CAF4601764.1 unnamed protein product [Rotaria sp. Silwood1]